MASSSNPIQAGPLTYAPTELKTSVEQKFALANIDIYQKLRSGLNVKFADINWTLKASSNFDKFTHPDGSSDKFGNTFIVALSERQVYCMHYTQDLNQPMSVPQLKKQYLVDETKIHEQSSTEINADQILLEGTLIDNSDNAPLIRITSKTYDLAIELLKNQLGAPVKQLLPMSLRKVEPQTGSTSYLRLFTQAVYALIILAGAYTAYKLFLEGRFYNPLAAK